MSDLIRRAHAFAIAAHGDQRRKYTGEPYIRHCEAVAELVRSVVSLAITERPQAMVAAALLHDVLEDCLHIKPADIHDHFGRDVARFVMEVTDASKTSDGNRARRKEIDRQHLSRASPEGKTIKLADLIDNTSTIVRYDPGFARVYLPEKARLLEVLEGGSPVLMARARGMVEEGMMRLGDPDANS